MGQVSELSTPEIIGITAIASLAISKAFEMVRRSRVRNGHAAPEKAAVTKETAPDFWLLQSEMKASVLRSEEMIRDIHSEMLNEQVKRHHR